MVYTLTFLGFRWLLPRQLISLDWLVCNHDSLGFWTDITSNTGYLSALLYNSSIVIGGSKDSDLKKGVDGPKLLLKCWKTASMLYDSICWMACPNLLLKSRIDSSCFLRIVCKELMFLFFRAEQRYCDANTANSSLNEFIELRGSFWN